VWVLLCVGSVVAPCGQELVRYIVTIDAGSSGSRVHVHHYFHSGGEIPQFQPKSFTTKLKPGLSSFVDKTGEAGESIRGLLEFSKEHIPEILWGITPVYLKATAGLRSIPSEKAHQILQSCREVIKEFPFMFDESDAEIISGTEEGVFGWVASNYLKSQFAGDGLDTVGLIEMGGASLQVSFVPKTPVSKSDETKLVPVKIGSKSFKLYTYSFLNYGLEAAQSLFASKLKALSPSDSTVDNPCYPVGVEFDGTQGSGVFDQCLKKMDDIIDLKMPCPSTCSFNGVFQPPVSVEKFLAIENFYYTAEFFNVLSSQDVINDLENAARSFCSLKFNDILSKYATEKDPAEELKKYCFSAAYISKILRVVTKKSDPSSMFSVTKYVGNAAIDWALGSVIFEVVNDARLSPSEWTLSRPSSGGPSLSSWISLEVLMFLAVVAMLIFFVRYFFRSSIRRSVIPYTRVKS